MKYVTLFFVGFVMGIGLDVILRLWKRNRILLPSSSPPLETVEDILMRIKEKLNSEVNKDDREKIIADADDYFDTYYPNGYGGD